MGDQVTEPTNAIARRAIIDWCDDQRLAIALLLNRAAIEALEDVAPGWREASFGDAWFDADGYAAPKIDAAIVARVAPQVSDFLTNAQRALKQIDVRLATVAATLTEPDWPVLPSFPAAVEPSALVELTTAPANALPLGSYLQRAWDMAEDALSKGSTQVLESAGVYQWLDEAARRRVSQRWIGMEPEAGTVIAQLDGSFVAAAEQAREVIG
jgi:hypothetical protein